MSGSIDKRIAELIITGRTAYSAKARRKMFDLGLIADEVEHSILRGVLYKRE